MQKPGKNRFIALREVPRGEYSRVAIKGKASTHFFPPSQKEELKKSSPENSSSRPQTANSIYLFTSRQCIIASLPEILCLFCNHITRMTHKWIKRV